VCRAGNWDEGNDEIVI